jgi:hypothetical protein
MPLTKIQSLGITDGTIVNADINASAAIAGTKLSGAGKVLQVVSTTKTDRFSVASSSFTDVTGLSVSITPSSTSNKILILSNFCCSFSGNSRIAYFNLVRGSTDIAQPSVSGSTTASYTYDVDQLHAVAINYLDSPSTTSSTTYKIQTKLNNADTSVIIGDRNNGDIDVISTITVMEIAV